METLKNYLLKHSEQTFVLLILISAAGINYLIPYKLVFLNFYFLVILLGTYYLEVHKAVLGGVLSALVVIIHVYYFPSYFSPAFTDLDLWMNILVWSSFLILTGAVVGLMTNNLKDKVEELKKANRELQDHAQKMEEWLAKLASLKE